jgi:hypothetical protein
MNNMSAGEYRYRLIDDLGQEIQFGNFIHPGGNATNTIAVSRSLAKGNYLLEIFLPDGVKTTLSIIID